MISINAKAEAEHLLSELFGFAEKMLTQYGEFHPFGGYLDMTGRLVHVGLDDEDAQKKAAKEELTLLKDALRSIAKRSGGRAFGYAVDVVVPSAGGEKKDAIQFFLEHKKGYCAEVFFVYTLDPVRGVEVKETFAQEGTRLFFA